MRRLTYSPHAWVFIRSSNLGGRIYDVSDDLARGSVTQTVNDVCKVQFELRNRFKKWLRDPVSKQSIFLPMDLVTVWLQRLPGMPIQQFTGYLDSVPYYQAYPANAVFTATCTLKKAAFTWFDPGLATFQQWLVSNGWTFNPNTGQAINPATYYDSTNVTKNTPLASNINDGGIGELLARFMVEVALWRPNDVLVSDLPPDLPKIAASLYQDLADAATKDLTTLSEFMSRAMGVKGANLTSSTASTASTSGTPIMNKTIALANILNQKATDSNIPPIVLAYAAKVMTNFNETYSYGKADGARWGYGIYALRPNNSVNGQDVLSVGARNFTTTDLLSAGNSSEALCQLLHGGLAAVNKNWLTGARRNDPQALHDWVAFATKHINSAPNAIEDAKAFLGAGVSNAATGSAQSINPDSISWDTPKLQNLLSAKEKQIITTYYASKAAWLAALAYRVKYFDINLRIARPPSSFHMQDNQLYIAGEPAHLDAFFTSLIGDSSLQSVDRFGATHQLLRSGVVSNTHDVTIILPTVDSIVIEQTTPAGFVANTASAATMTASTTATSTSSSPGTVSAADLAAFSATSAFAANLAFPTDIIESQLLTGEKALMNDTSCLDAIKQFAAASLRAFRTLPDGRFLAFYPDYFGAYRDPYWKIENIELVDFGIQLNDEQLATHVYVTGDTINFDGQVDMFEEVGTTGVATIDQANMLSSFIEPWSKDKSATVVGRLNSSFSFLEHYGARPLPEKQPLIRNTAYEFLYAWQLFMQKWASQFSTSVEFTFHPEIMAGGLIEFPDHRVQCFVESVTHTWDYESGFTTEAVLSAPSLPKAYRDRGWTHPGFALAGGINSVGIGI